MNKNLKYFLATLGFSLLVVLLLSRADFWRLTDQKSYDILSILAPPSVDASDILIVSIDEASFNDIQMFWPWPRAMHARLLDRIANAGAKTVAFDLLLSEPSSFGAEDDQALAEAIGRHPGVSVVFAFSELALV